MSMIRLAASTCSTTLEISTISSASALLDSGRDLLCLGSVAFIGKSALRAWGRGCFDARLPAKWRRPAALRKTKPVLEALPFDSINGAYQNTSLPKPMPLKDPKSLRSYRWYGPDDLRSFGHRSRAASMGCVQADYAGKPVIAIIN